MPPSTTFSALKTAARAITGSRAKMRADYFPLEALDGA